MQLVAARWPGRTLFILLTVTTLLAAADRTANAQGTTASSVGSQPADLQSAKAVLAKYSDPFAAVRDGFLSTLACIDFPKGAADGDVIYPPGAMGVHFINMGNIGPNLDPAKPQVLIYEPVKDKLRLVAAEWFVPVEAAGGVRPEIFGQKLLGPMDGHEPIMPAALRHYDLHVWMWQDNPRGMFTSTNAAVKCPKAAYTVEVPSMEGMKH